MATYYIDPIRGNGRNDGLSPESPLATNEGLPLCGGDTVLFRRGRVIRGCLHNLDGEQGKPITYDAYGDEKLGAPVFCGSVDMLEAEWIEESPNIWVTRDCHDEVCNIQFVRNGVESFGTLCWTPENLSHEFDFWDNAFGTHSNGKPLPYDHIVRIFCPENPIKHYEVLEFSVYGPRFLAVTGKNVILRNLEFRNSGVHAIAGSSGKNMTVIHCTFRNIGGCTWNAERRIRFGNAIEMWNEAEHIEVSGCTFDNIYDSAVTHQGAGEKCSPAVDLQIIGNTFLRCGMAAYEQRDKMTVRSSFRGNVCSLAGCGFSRNGVVMPRNSEIWPQPMGHHIFLWRIEGPSLDGGLEITNNVFDSAPYGAPVYSIISRDAEAQMHIDSNRYTSSDFALFNRLDGMDYESADTYIARSGFDRNSFFEK